MKFIVDHQLPPDLARWLVGKGHEADHVFLLGLGDADDGRIWDFAVLEAAVIITKDADFANRRYARGDGPTIVWLRIGNATTSALLEWLKLRWDKVMAALEQGRSVIEVR